MEWSALVYLSGIILNWSTYLYYGGMPVPRNGIPGTRLSSRHIIGWTPFGDNIPFPPGWMTSIGDWMIIGGTLILWVSTITFLIGRIRARRNAKTI